MGSPLGNKKRNRRAMDGANGLCLAPGWPEKKLAVVARRRLPPNFATVVAKCRDSLGTTPASARATADGCGGAVAQFAARGAPRDTQPAPHEEGRGATIGQLVPGAPVVAARAPSGAREKGRAPRCTCDQSDVRGHLRAGHGRRPRNMGLLPNGNRGARNVDGAR